MNKKNTFGILLIIVSILLIGYGVFSFFVFSDDSEIEKPKNPLGNEINAKELKEFESLARRYIFWSRFFPFENVSEIPNQYLIYVGIDGKDTSATDVEKKVSEYFGNQVKVNHEDYVCSFDNHIYYKYDSEKNMYLIEPSKSDLHSHEGSFSSDVKMYYLGAINGYEKDGVYTINTKMLYVCEKDPKIGDFYASYSDCTKEDSIPVFENPEGYAPTQSGIDLAGDKLPITTFTFYKENGNYVLKSVTINEDK